MRGRRSYAAVGVGVPAPAAGAGAEAAPVSPASSSLSSSAPLRQSQVMQRSMTPRLFSFLTTNFAWHAGHGCGIGLSHETKSHSFFFQFEQP